MFSSLKIQIDHDRFRLIDDDDDDDDVNDVEW